MPSGECCLLGWLNRNIVDPLKLIIRRGAEPKQLAFSTALGVTLGIFPICGTTVFLCGLAIVLLGSRCHAPSVMLFNFIATPIELSLVIPFLRLGELITGGPRFPLTSDVLKKILTGQASIEIFISILHAVLLKVGKQISELEERTLPTASLKRIYTLSCLYIYFQKWYSFIVSPQDLDETLPFSELCSVI